MNKAFINGFIKGAAIAHMLVGPIGMVLILLWHSPWNASKTAATIYFAMGSVLGTYIFGAMEREKTQ